MVEARIHGKTGSQRPPTQGRPAPLYAFVIFDTAEAVEAALNKKVTGWLLFSS